MKSIKKDHDFYKGFVFAFRLTLKEENFAGSTVLSVSDIHAGFVTY